MSLQSPDLSDDPAFPGLVQHIAALIGGRVIVAIAGAPGSGKSTLAAQVVAKLSNAVLVPMDGFHLDNTVLKKRGLLNRKGAIETFDAHGFAALVGRLANPAQEVVYPIFDRNREIALAGAGVVDPEHKFVVIEGNYLLADTNPWNDIVYDLTVALDVPEPILRQRLTARWRALGQDKASVARHLANDLANARFIAQNARSADLVISLGKNSS